MNKYPSASELAEFEKDVLDLPLEQRHKLARSALDQLGADLRSLNEKKQELQYLFTCWEILHNKYTLEIMRANAQIKKIPTGKSGLNLARLKDADRRFLMDRLGKILGNRVTVKEKREGKGEDIDRE